MAKVGKRLRELRLRRAISIRELASRSGVSHSTISLIEQDGISPTVNTLQAVMDALGTTLSGFFTGIETNLHYSPFYRSADLPEIGSADSISYQVIGADHPDRTILMLRENYARGADTGTPFAHPAQEAGVVVTGSIELTVGTQTAVLEPGDGYYFDSRQPHRFRNVFDGESQIVSAVNPPTY